MLGPSCLAAPKVLLHLQRGMRPREAADGNFEVTQGSPRMPLGCCPAGIVDRKQALQKATLG